MSQSLGPLTYGKKEEQVFLGKEFNRHQDYSEATALQIDAEIKRIVSEQYDRAHETLTKHGGLLKRVAEALLEHEVLDAEQLKALVEGRAIAARQPAVVAPPPPPAREGKVDDGEQRSGGFVPPLPTPKPTAS
jgi:cell division protease FtsH